MDNIQEIREFVQMFKDLGVKSFSDVSTGLAVEFFESKQKLQSIDLVEELKEESKDKMFGGMPVSNIKEFI